MGLPHIYGIGDVCPDLCWLALPTGNAMAILARMVEKVDNSADQRCRALHTDTDSLLQFQSLFLPRLQFCWLLERGQDSTKIIFYALGLDLVCD